MAKARVLLVALVMVSIAATGWAGPVSPPAWRGYAGTNYQEWQFSTDANPAAPELSFGRTEFADIQPGAYSSGWFDGDLVFGSRQGFWDLGSAGRISVDVPSYSQPRGFSELGFKEVWVQVTYFKDLSAKPVVTVPGAQPVGDPVITLVEYAPFGGSWYEELTKWRVYTNFGTEEILITSDAKWGSLVDSVVVDSVFVAEPASMTLMVLGGLVLAIRKRFRHLK